LPDVSQIRYTERSFEADRSLRRGGDEVVDRSRPDCLESLRGAAAAIRQRFGVRRLAVFGSVARGEARSHSDVDLLVAFEGPADFDRFMDLKFYLEDLLGRRVDLVTPLALRPELRERIEREAIGVA
jgi:predicted nucleotidyltransferase